MATKADFTEAQWDELRFAAQDTMAFVAFANGVGFWESIKEAAQTARYITTQIRESRSTLVRDLANAGGSRHDKLDPSDEDGFEREVLGTIAEAVRIVAETAPDELDGFKGFILGVAGAAAEASGAIDDREQLAIEKIKSALI